MAKKKELTEEERLEKALVPENEWPYELPEGWKWVRLEGLCNEIQYGYTAKAENNESFPKLLRITDLKKDGVNWSSVPNCNIKEENFIKYKIKEGDIFFARTGATTGKSYLVRNVPRAVFASYLIRLQVNRMILNDYLYNFLQSGLYWNQISDLSSGIAQPGVNSKKLREIIIPLAPIEKQQQIVDQIESLFSKLEEAKEKVESVLESSENRKSAILHKAFTGELTKKWREENGVSLDSWEEVDLNKVLGQVKEKENEFLDSTVSYIGLEHLEKNNGIIGYSKVDGIKSAKTKFKENDILYGRLRPYLNKHDVVNFKGVCSTDILVFESNANVNPVFINYYFDTNDFKMYAINNSSGINLPRISAKSVLNYRIYLPSIEEQEEIVEILDRFLGNEDISIEVGEQVLEQIDLEKKSILAQVFRGNF